MKLTKKVTMLAATLGVFGLIGVAVNTPAYAEPACTGSGVDCITQGAKNAQTGGATTGDIPHIFQTVTDILLFVIGAVSVIMIVVGGLKYTTSNGNADQIKSAKNTIMYAVVGVVVAILAYAIVHFIVSKLT